MARDKNGKNPPKAAAAALDAPRRERVFKTIFEDPAKMLLLGCRKCGACGGSQEGRCEVSPDRPCVWFRAYNRLSQTDETTALVQDCVPLRMWELDQSSAWLNFHRKRDH